MHLPGETEARDVTAYLRRDRAEHVASGGPPVFRILFAPPGPGSYPGSFSVVDPTDAVFVGDSAAAGTAACMVLSNGGSTVRRTGRIDDVQETFDAAFTSTSTGWVLVRQGSGDFVIEATTDGGYHWSPQLSVTVQSPG